MQSVLYAYANMHMRIREAATRSTIVPACIALKYVPFSQLCFILDFVSYVVSKSNGKHAWKHGKVP